MDGIIIINKESGSTSRDVVNYLNDLFEMKKIGHAGTLDPLATGVLVVALGKCTKLIDILNTQDKEYVATMKLGTKTDTYDIEGTVLSQNDVSFDYNDIINAINSFKCEYEQEVPIYSAVKVHGKRLYNYARNNEKVILPKRRVNIKEIEIINIENDLVTFKVLVSKGTYIRSLINDIGNKLGCGAIMTSLTRTKQGNYRIEDALSLSELSSDLTKIIPLKDILLNYPSSKVNGDKEKLITNGAVIDKEFTTKYHVYYNEENKPLAIYQEYAKDNTKAKPFLMI